MIYNCIGGTTIVVSPDKLRFVSQKNEKKNLNLWEMLMPQQPWQQFLPTGKAGEPEASETHQEAFFHHLLTPQTSPRPLFSDPRFFRLLQCSKRPSPSSSSSGTCAGVLLTQHSPHRGRTTTRRESVRCCCCRQAPALCELWVVSVGAKARHE